MIFDVFDAGGLRPVRQRPGRRDHCRGVGQGRHILILIRIRPSRKNNKNLDQDPRIDTAK